MIVDSIITSESARARLILRVLWVRLKLWARSLIWWMQEGLWKGGSVFLWHQVSKCLSSSGLQAEHSRISRCLEWFCYSSCCFQSSRSTRGRLCASDILLASCSTLACGNWHNRRGIPSYWSESSFEVIASHLSQAISILEGSSLCRLWWDFW